MQLSKAAIAEVNPGPEYDHILKPSPVRRFTKKLFQIYCKLLFTFYCPVKVTGRENLPDASFILCSNHNSHMDTGALMLASGLSFNRFGMMAASDYFFNNHLRRIFLGLLMDLVPVNRKPSRHEVLKMLAACRQFTQNGQRSLILYPEGTRSKTGEMQRFKRGAAMIAVELGLPLVPAYVEGTFRAMPKGRSLMKPSRIKVRIGEPIYPDAVGANNGHPKSTVYRQLTSELKNRICQLSQENGHAS